MNKLLTIITATKNSAEDLIRLAEDLAAQDDQEFTWVVVDSLSRDHTHEILSRNYQFSLVSLVEPDSGIYNALNKGIKLSDSKYYLVCGSDDRLYPNAISSIKKCILDNNTPEIILNSMHIGERPIEAFWGSNSYCLGANRLAPGHSIGLVVSKILHDRFGYYREDLVLASDAAFIYKIYDGKVSFALNPNFVGKFNVNGLSNTSRLKQICETFEVQMDSKCPSIVSFLIFTIRFFLFTINPRKNGGTF
ncbi:glycosyltransferase [Alphaproteobacteria bacterium]|nr:glycosyltransferase [Alphaproteobacteria bacterium]